VSNQLEYYKVENYSMEACVLSYTNTPVVLPRYILKELRPKGIGVIRLIAKKERQKTFNQDVNNSTVNLIVKALI
jgi:hypothetical protein